jgi:hypothetical protein
VCRAHPLHHLLCAPPPLFHHSHEMWIAGLPRTSRASRTTSS